MTHPENSLRRIRVLHVVHRFDIGGLENVIVQLINRLPADRFEHMVLSLTTITDFKDRISQPGVQFIALDKPPGHAVPLYPRIFKLLRKFSPHVMHTCNFAALELTPLAWLARVPVRVHAEHGWDVNDPDGTSVRHQLVRRLYKPFVTHYVAVSRDIETYVASAIGVPAIRRSWIANGVDTDSFSPANGDATPVPGCPFEPGRHWIVGTVGRLQTIKNQTLLARAFVRLLRDAPALAETARLIIVGDGPLRAEVERILAEAGVSHLAWLPGARSDVAAILRMFDLFVLPSLAEGTSCTLQEAMATGLPVIATAVGGNPELVREQSTGLLVPSGDDAAMAKAMHCLEVDRHRSQAFGRTARSVAETEFDINTTVARYMALFEPSR